MSVIDINERLDQKRREKLDPDGLFYRAQFEHDDFYTRQEANYKRLETARSNFECLLLAQRELLEKINKWRNER